jgi:hypothetical protein
MPMQKLERTVLNLMAIASKLQGGTGLHKSLKHAHASCLCYICPPPLPQDHNTNAGAQVVINEGDPILLSKLFNTQS